LEKTEFIKDPVSPIQESNIAERLKRQTSRSIGTIRLSLVRTNTADLKEEIRKLIYRRKRNTCYRCGNPNDLTKIADASHILNVLLCGSQD